jgi:hypothetical protein
MDNIFLFKLLISFFAGSAWVVFATILAAQKNKLLQATEV